MHRTTTTNLSDALDRVVDINTQLDDVEWTPIEQRVHLCILGSIVVQGIIDGTSITDFTDKEQTFIEQTVDRLNFILEDMTLESGSDSDWNC